MLIGLQYRNILPHTTKSWHANSNFCMIRFILPDIIEDSFIIQTIVKEAFKATKDFVTRF